MPCLSTLFIQDPFTTNKTKSNINIESLRPLLGSYLRGSEDSLNIRVAIVTLQSARQISDFLADCLDLFYNLVFPRLCLLVVSGPLLDQHHYLRIFHVVEHLQILVNIIDSGSAVD